MMTTISERLRRDSKGDGAFVAIVPLHGLRHEAADTIDALVAALESYDAMARGVTPDANTQTPEEMTATRESIFAAGQAALALARKS